MAGDSEESTSGSSNIDDAVEFKVIVNTLLAYAQYCISCATADNTHHVLCSHFSSTEISVAKDVLWKTMEYAETKRTNSSKRTVDEANISDILTALYKLDQMDDIPLFYINPKGIGRLPRFNPENLNVVAMDQRLAETVDQCRVLQGQVESYRTLAIRCNNRMDEYETVLQQHTNALRDLSERHIAPKNAVTNDDEIPDKDDGTKNESNVTTSTISSKSGRSNSMPNIKVPTTLSDQLSVVGDNAMSSAKTIPSNREPPKSTCKTSYASMLSENQFKPIFNDMQSSVDFKKFPPVSDEHVKTSTRLMQPEKDYKSFCAFSCYQHENGDVLQHHEEQGTSGYQINNDDKRRQRQFERRRNKVIHGASASLGSRFRGGPETRDLSDIFVFHVASDSTIGDVKAHLKQQDFDVQQMRIDITSNKDSLYRSFRIIAPGEYKDILMCPKVWPVGVKVREYKSRSYGRNHNNAGHNTYGGGRFKQ